MATFALICFVNTVFLLVATHYSFKLIDSGRIFCLNFHKKINSNMGFLLPAIYFCFVVMPSELIPPMLVDHLNLGIHEFWTMIPAVIVMTYCLLFKYEAAQNEYLTFRPGNPKVYYPYN